ncbi:auxin-responsive protein SAUR68-like [Tripterygium wilfordii]|uniref:auxin-responsive protein SAUR68-like n=1 Tax=Tripterygium wilfordii TaxID=458696 RepID=UPI0018F7EB8A|nr:auxin-responsive protein SAUR68-like [Tripterygium wilfordii]
MAKMWQNLALIGKKRISTTRTNAVSAANRGHFVIYPNDQRRFAMPLLLKMSEDEDGISGDGPSVSIHCTGVTSLKALSLANIINSRPLFLHNTTIAYTTL